MASLAACHIPVCPFSHRLEILLALPEALPCSRSSRPPIERSSRKAWLSCNTWKVVFPEPAIAQRDPYLRAVENMLTGMEADFGMQGYLYMMNQDPARRLKA